MGVEHSSVGLGGSMEKGAGLTLSVKTRGESVVDVDGGVVNANLPLLRGPELGSRWVIKGCVDNVMIS